MVLILFIFYCLIYKFLKNRNLVHWLGGFGLGLKFSKQRSVVLNNIFGFKVIVENCFLQKGKALKQI